MCPCLIQSDKNDDDNENDNSHAHVAKQFYNAVVYLTVFGFMKPLKRNKSGCILSLYYVREML